MRGQDLKASFVIVAVWVVGVTMYSIWEGPLGAGAEDLFTGTRAEVLALQEGPKHWKLPARWTHQRWGAD
jgi:hypothetical protein